MKHIAILLAIASGAFAGQEWEPIAPDAIARFARDTTRAHQIDSVARVQAVAANAIRQNALQNLGEDIHYAQGDSVDLQRGLIKRINVPDFRK